MAKPESEEWRQATTDALNAISTLIEIQNRIQEKLDNVSEDKLDEPEALMYQEVCDLNLSEAFDTISDASNIVV